MIELKAGVIKTPHDEGMSFNRDSDHVAVTEGETEFYLKSEADKVIEELKHQRDGAFGLANSGLTLDDLSQMAKKETDQAVHCDGEAVQRVTEIDEDIRGY